MTIDVGIFIITQQPACRQTRNQLIILTKSRALRLLPRAFTYFIHDNEKSQLWGSQEATKTQAPPFSTVRLSYSAVARRDILNIFTYFVADANTKPRRGYLRSFVHRGVGKYIKWWIASLDGSASCPNTGRPAAQRKLWGVALQYVLYPNLFSCQMQNFGFALI